MKTTFYTILGLTVFFAALYFADQYNKLNTHPTLNDSAEIPDNLLIEVVIANQRGEKNESIIKLERTIKSLWILEKDLDENGALLLENVIQKLETLHKLLITDAASAQYIRQVYKDVLGSLAAIQLRVAKNQLQTDKTSKARIALKYAYIHLKNAQIFQNSAAQSKEDLQLERLTERIDMLISKNNLISEKFDADSMIELINNIKN
jgi:hypothetical protein